MVLDMVGCWSSTQWDKSSFTHYWKHFPKMQWEHSMLLGLEIKVQRHLNLTEIPSRS